MTLKIAVKKSQKSLYKQFLALFSSVIRAMVEYAVKDSETIAKLEKLAEEQAPRRTELKAFLNIEDETWYIIKPVAVRSGVYKKKTRFHRPGEEYLEVETENYVIRAKKETVWIRQLHEFCKEHINKPIAFKKFRPEGKSYKVIIAVELEEETL